MIAVNWGTNIKSSNFQPIAVGLTLFANISILGPVSGGHFNPAVTLGVFFKEGKSKFNRNGPFMLIIWFGQITGAIFGAFISWLGQQNANIETDKTQPAKQALYPGIALLCPRIENYDKLKPIACDSEYFLGTFIVEFLMTFVFVNVILSIKYHNGANDLLVNALAIGLTLFGVITISGGISGGCINPAVGLV